MSLPEHPKLSIRYAILAFIEGIAGFGLVLGLLFLAYTDRLNLLSLAGVQVNTSEIKSFADKFEFTVKHWTPGLVWLYFYIHLVMLRRLNARAVIPNTTREYLVANQRSILTQTVEQFIFAVVTQAAVLPYLTPIQVVNIIPLANLLFFVGRIFFWLGYPIYRTFGMVVTMAPFSLILWFLTIQYTRENNLI